MYKIKIEVRFRAGHRLMNPYKGKCNHPHGEGYTAILEFGEEELDDKGMVMDFGFVKKTIKEFIDDYFDHAYLCREDDEVGLWLREKKFKVFMFEDNPTAEVIAKWIYDKFITIYPQLKKVGIVESFEDSVAYYEGEENESL